MNETQPADDKIIKQHFDKTKGDRRYSCMQPGSSANRPNTTLALPELWSNKVGAIPSIEHTPKKYHDSFASMKILEVVDYEGLR